MPELYYEDFEPGSVTAFSAREPVSKEQIIAFARQFDPQPFHLDEEAAKRSMLGGLCASGWHTSALVMRLNYDGWIHRTASMGAPGIDEVRWAKPVRPGDMLQMTLKVLDKRVSRSRPEMGLVALYGEVANGNGDVVMTQKHTQLIEVRHPSGEAAPVDQAAGRTIAPQTPANEDASDSSDLFAPCFEDIIVGAPRTLGTETLTREAIIAFASEYDPQPFHLDDEAARNSHFGALAASGWHTGALWMRSVIATRDRVVRERQEKGLSTPVGGPSPGFTNLRWIKPVYAGDTLTFGSRVLEKRLTSKPGWGLIFSDNSGVNQHGERVYEFRGSAFVPLRGTN